jgi:hypothetical protein
MTQALDRTDVEEDLSHISPDDPDNSAHYVSKRQLDKMLFNEVSTVTALCGHKLTTIYKPVNGRPVCSKCKRIYEGDEPNPHTGDFMGD